MMVERISLKSGKWLYVAGVSLVVIAFFAISCFGFFTSDDYTMARSIASLKDVVKETIHFVMGVSGRLLSTFAQYLFCGLLGENKLWFDVFNTLFFLVFIVFGSKLMSNGNSIAKEVLSFALLFWFLCPVPDETLFWPAGATVYLWTSTLALMFIVLFEHNKDKDYSLGIKLLLFVFSMICASEMVSATAVSGAIVLSTLFCKKKLKSHEVFLAVGFFLGTVFLLFSPGNFARMNSGSGEFSLLSYFRGMFSPMRVLGEFVKYRVLWMFVVSWVLCIVAKKRKTIDWCRENVFLLLVLGISFVAASFLYFGYISSVRSMFFPEVIALVLLVKILNDVFGTSDEKERTDIVLFAGKYRLSDILLSVLFIVFVFDATRAVKEVRQQHENNERMLEEIYNANGVVALDVPVSAHRMAIVPIFPKWSWEGVAYKLELDSVHVYPYYCQDKYFEPPLRFAENVYVDKVGVYDAQGMVVIRRPETSFMKDFVCRIDYEKPRKWYRHWLDEICHYRYERSVEGAFTEPMDCFEGYCYYLVWMSKENCGNIKRIVLLE